MQKITIPVLAKRKQSGQPRIAMVTAYDFTMARMVDAAGVDIILVGDSLGMVVQGLPNTLEVTLEQMAYHTRCVSRGAGHAHVVADMPFGSYHLSPTQAVQSAIHLVKEGGAESVKLEGGQERVADVRAIVNAQIPVMGHVGLTPQSVHRIGGFKVQGRGSAAADKVFDDAVAIAEAGAFALVLEGIPADLAKRITAAIDIPTIGIGAGPHCDGQVLVCTDLLGADPDFTPKFLKKYADLHGLVQQAVGSYIDEVRAGTFPGPQHSFKGKRSKNGVAAVKPMAEVTPLYGGGAG